MMVNCQNCGIEIGRRTHKKICVKCVIGQKSRAQWQKRKREDDA